MSEVKETEFNGKPVMQIIRSAEDKFGFQFGAKKARLIVEHYDTIKAFADKYDKVPAQVA